MAAPHLSRTQSKSNHECSRIFQPPQHTPSASSSAQGDYFSTGSRKRSRADSSQRKRSHMIQDWQIPAWVRDAASPLDDGASSTESFVNEKYALKGGFDTPGLFADTDLDTVQANDAYARKLMSDPVASYKMSEPTFAGPLARERNGYARNVDIASFSNPSPSWTRLAITLPFSIAGKMFTFGSSVIKGFYAGGGQGYELDKDAGRKRQWLTTLDQATPVPGSWYESPPQNDFMGDFEQDNTPTSTRPPPNKRRLTDKDSWVVVGTPDLEEPTSISPKRRAGQSTPRAVRPTTSRTSSRRTFAPRRQSYNTATPATMSQSAHLTRLSMPARPISPTNHSPKSYHSPDAERYARRQAKQERAADKAMNSMSQKLEELIRQGQAALGTKFTIEDNGDDDEGFVDDY